MLKNLVLCESCSRHVRSTESKCPFCGAERASTEPAALSPFRPANRAAVFFFTATSLVACGKKDAAKSETDVTPDAANTAVMAPPYGAPVIDDPPPPPPPPPVDAGRQLPAPPYGMPPVRDKGPPKRPQ